MSRYLNRWLDPGQPMIRVVLFSVAFGLTFLMPGTTPCLAQSSVVKLPGEIGSPVNVVQPTTDLISNSLTPQQRQAESMLGQPTPDAWRQEMKLGRLLQMMSRSGIQIVLDESAGDNNLDENASIRLALHHASIAANLQFALIPFQCDFRILDSGAIQIASEDALLDNLSTITFNVRQLVNDSAGMEELTDLIQEAIDPDSWDSNGGTGRLVSFQSEQGYLLTITQTWSNQSRIRQQMESLVHLGGRGGGILSASNTLGTSSDVSRSVALPDEYLALRRNRRGLALPGSGTTGGFGGGGGLGGGVF